MEIEQEKMWWNGKVNVLSQYPKYKRVKPYPLLLILPKEIEMITIGQILAAPSEQRLKDGMSVPIEIFNDIFNNRNRFSSEDDVAYLLCILLDKVNQQEDALRMIKYEINRFCLD